MVSSMVIKKYWHECWILQTSTIFCPLSFTCNIRIRMLHLERSLRIKLNFAYRIGIQLHSTSSLSCTNSSKILLYWKSDYETDMLKFSFSKVPHRIYGWNSFTNLIYFRYWEVVLNNTVEESSILTIKYYSRNARMVEFYYYC